MNAERHGWTTLAPAKVNLDLRMRGVRADGYHLLSTVLQTVDLADRVSLLPAEGAFSLTCDTPGVPLDASNLAWRGAMAMASAAGTSLDGWRLHLQKLVPAEAGLGGGSADAVAAARLVAAAADVALRPTQLADIVRPLGADVAFFAWGGTVRGEGVGDELTPLADVPTAQVILVRPPFGVSTSAAYRWYDADAGAVAAPPAVAAEAVGSSEVAWAACRNDLEAPVAARHPEIRAIVARLRAAGAWLAAMSGSGSACFGLYDPSVALTPLLTGWPAGTRAWCSTLLPREVYAAVTRCRPLARW